MLELSKFIDKDHLHHAYIIEGEGKSVIPQLFDFLESMGIKTKGNPNVWHGVFDMLTIDQARELKGLQAQRAFGKDTDNRDKFFIIQAQSFTHEAQQALLKVLEDPTPGVHFFIVTSRVDSLISTLQSRSMIISMRPHHNEVDKADRFLEAKSFISGGKEERLGLIKKFIKKYEEDPASLKTEALGFLNDLELTLKQEKGRNRNTIADYRYFEEIWKCRDYLGRRGSSSKMLLEHLALVI